MTKIPIKNMVCRHCMEAVLGVFRDLELEVSAIRLGEATVVALPSEINFPQLKTALFRQGFELLEDRELQIVEQIKTAVISLIHHSGAMPEVKNSVFLSERLGLSYAYLSKLFSGQEGLTIERYIILQKIEKVKELLSYGEKSLSEIAYDLGYSSVQHLSSQFRSVTGMSVTQYKQLEIKPRRALNEVK
ncbi:MAG: helix-turn-helix transcriptional regulator [Lewinellaceae bacterium]|nr:helix-turn-helix transcriptional regulator [Saprospiraceae bacterium]MCB9339611.1 helix-turn-helix transcriptional regulator [Lewinellaceae bacterium]